MALENIKPLTYQNYVMMLGNSVDAIVGVLENHQRGGWWEALQRYQFQNMDYIAGQDVRMQFHELLVNAADLADLVAVSNQILRWSNMPHLNEQMENSLQESLIQLANENHGNLNQVCAKRIASISKIYEMWEPTEWIIYDSYCAKGLQWLVSQIWNQNDENANAILLRFPWPPGRVGGPVNGFPRLGTENQARLGFLYASWLCRAIAEQLNNNERHDLVWRAYHIEMVAFQIGHEV